jgi:hypothetical protein
MMQLIYAALEATVRTGKRAIARPAFFAARLISYARCRLSQNCGPVPNQWPSRNAVSPVTARVPAMIWLTRLSGHCDLARQRRRRNAHRFQLLLENFARIYGAHQHRLVLAPQRLHAVPTLSGRADFPIRRSITAVRAFFFYNLDMLYYLYEDCSIQSAGDFKFGAQM